MTTAVIPDPQSFLPAMPPLVMVILHWIIVIVVGMAIVGAIGSLLWGYYKDAWVRQYKMPYPKTKWSQRLDLWLPLVANLPHFLNKWAKSKGLPTYFKFIPEDLTIPPSELPEPKYTVTAEDSGRVRLIHQVATGKTRIVSTMDATAAGLPSDRPWNSTEASQAYDMAEPYTAPILAPPPV